jgi:uncharacterized membrane protein YfhO
MIIDNFHQYTPFLMEFGEMLRNGQNLMFSWDSGLGTNYLARYAYYLSSPLNFLAVFFPAGWTHEFLLSLVLLRCGISGLTFFIYLEHKFKKADLKTVAFAVMYALPAYLIAYYWNVMWFDCIAIFPLVAMGIEKMVDENRFLLYCVSLSLTIICNFYIALIICIYVTLYFFVYLFSRHSFSDVKGWGSKSFAFVTYSILAGAMSAIVTLPAYYGLVNASAARAGFPSSIRFYSNMLDIIENHLMLVQPSITVGLPNIYCGVIVLALLPLYVLNTKIPIKEKILQLFLLALMLISFNINTLDFLWHGMHFPNSLFFRFAFLYVGLLLTLSYGALINLDGTPEKRVLTVAAAEIVILFFVEKMPSENINTAVIYVSLLFMLVYACLLYQFKRREQTGKPAVFLTAVLLIAVSVEIGLNAAHGIGQAGTHPRNNYLATRQEFLPAIQAAESLEKGFERMEFTTQTTYNTPVVYGYKGISYYSSTSYVNVNNLLDKMGLLGSSAWYVYRSSTPVLNSMLSVKYILGKSGEFSDHLYKQTDQVGDVCIYENPYYLPVGFMVRDEVADWACKQNNPFLVQQDFLDKATGQRREVFKPLTIREETLSNVEITDKTPEGEYRYRRTNTGGEMSAAFAVTAQEEGPAYLYIRSSRIQQAWITKGDATESHSIKYPYIIDMKSLKPGEEVRFRVTLEDSDSGVFYMYAYSFDDAAYRQVYNQLNRQGLEVSSYTDTQLTGSIHVTAPGTLFTSIPYDEGWTVRVDGQKVQKNALGEGAFIALSLSEGVHDIQFSYRTQGLLPGVFVTLASIALLVYRVKF